MLKQLFLQRQRAKPVNHTSEQFKIIEQIVNTERAIRDVSPDVDELLNELSDLHIELRQLDAFEAYNLGIKDTLQLLDM